MVEGDPTNRYRQKAIRERTLKWFGVQPDYQAKQPNIEYHRSIKRGVNRQREQRP